MRHDAPPATVTEVWCESNEHAGLQTTQTIVSNVIIPADTRLHPNPSGTEPTTKCFTRFAP